MSFKKDLKKGKVAWRKNLWAMERGMSDVWELSINSTQQEVRVGQQTWIPCAGVMLPRPKASCRWCYLEGEAVGRRPPLGRQWTFPSGRRNDFSNFLLASPCPGPRVSLGFPGCQVTKFSRTSFVDVTPQHPPLAPGFCLAQRASPGHPTGCLVPVRPGSSGADRGLAPMPWALFETDSLNPWWEASLVA